MYTAPCIIGTLLSLEERQLIVDRDLDESSFDLVSKYILIPSEQVDDAVALQEVFDTPEDYSNEVFEEYACQIMNKYSTSE